MATQNLSETRWNWKHSIDFHMHHNVLQPVTVAAWTDPKFPSPLNTNTILVIIKKNKKNPKINYDTKLVLQRDLFFVENLISKNYKTTSLKQSKTFDLLI